MADDFMEDVGQAELLGTICGLLGRHPITVSVKPVITLVEGSHRMSGMIAVTEHGSFEVHVTPAPTAEPEAAAG